MVALSPSVSTLILGGEEIQSVRLNGARVMCGQGPPNKQGLDRERRLKSLLEALAPEVTAVVWAEQLHGAILASVAPEPGQALGGVHCIGRCDGLVTDCPGIAVLIWTADCLPVILVGGGVVAAVHAGWRGLAEGILTRAVRRMVAEYGVGRDEISAMLGPAVGPCHYQVGPEVIAALSQRGPAEHWWLDGDRADLRAFAEAELVANGLEADRILRVGGCTSCDPKSASYRRDGEEAGRQWTLAFRPSCP